MLDVGYILFMWGAVLGWTREEIQVYLAHLRVQLHDTSVHGYYMHRVVYGRKPFPGEVPEQAPTKGENEPLAGASRVTDRQKEKVKSGKAQGDEAFVDLADMSHLVTPGRNFA